MDVKNIIANGKGKHKVAQAVKTRDKIKKYISKNNGKTKKEICYALGITLPTLNAHLDAIFKGE